MNTLIRPCKIRTITMISEYIVFMIDIFIKDYSFIKTHDSELRGQEEAQQRT